MLGCMSRHFHFLSLCTLTMYRLQSVCTVPAPDKCNPISKSSPRRIPVLPQGDYGSWVYPRESFRSQSMRVQFSNHGQERRSQSQIIQFSRHGQDRRFPVPYNPVLKSRPGVPFPNPRKSSSQVTARSVVPSLQSVLRCPRLPSECPRSPPECPQVPTLASRVPSDARARLQILLNGNNKMF